MAMKFTNNAATTLASNITSSATSLAVSVGTGSLFPTLGGSDYFYCTLANTSGAIEIIKVTARSTDTFTVTRGQDGTSGQAWNSGDKVELRLVAASLNDIPKLDEANTFTATQTVTTLTSPAATNLLIQSAGTTAVTIDTSQNVGVNTTTPATYGKFVVNGQSAMIGGGAAQLGFYNSDNTNYYALGNQGATGSANAALTFYQGGGGAERMRLDASGNLGLGVTPTTRFSVDNARSDTAGTGWLTWTSTGNTTAKWGQRVNTSNVYAFDYYNGSAWANYLNIDSSGNLLVAKTALSTTTVGVELRPGGRVVSTLAASTNVTDTTYEVYSTGAGAYRFYVGMGGTVFATSTTITAISDQRLKQNIRDLDDGLASVMALKPRKFDWKEGKGQDIKDARGFIAQEFETVFPDMIDEWRDPAPEGEEPYKAINANLIPTLVKAIQEQQALIDTLTAKVAALEAK